MTVEQLVTTTADAVTSRLQDARAAGDDLEAHVVLVAEHHGNATVALLARSRFASSGLHAQVAAVLELACPDGFCRALYLTGAEWRAALVNVSPPRRAAIFA